MTGLSSISLLSPIDQAYPSSLCFSVYLSLSFSLTNYTEGSSKMCWVVHTVMTSVLMSAWDRQQWTKVLVASFISISRPQKQVCSHFFSVSLCLCSLSIHQSVAFRLTKGQWTCAQTMEEETKCTSEWESKDKRQSLDLINSLAPDVNWVSKCFFIASQTTGGEYYYTIQHTG